LTKLGGKLNARRGRHDLSLTHTRQAIWAGLESRGLLVYTSMHGIEVPRLGPQAATGFLLSRLWRRIRTLPADQHLGWPALVYPPEVMKRIAHMVHQPSQQRHPILEFPYLYITSIRR